MLRGRNQYLIKYKFAFKKFATNGGLNIGGGGYFYKKLLSYLVGDIESAVVDPRKDDTAFLFQ